MKEEDRQFLRPFYPSPYFFDAHVFRSFKLVSIELRKVYRQTDSTFINILDHIRTNMVTANDLQLLNNRVSAVSPSDSNGLSITLSTRRDTVDYINQCQLDKLPGEASVFMVI